MADSQLSVELIAKVGQFEKDLDDALKQIKKLAKEGDQAANDFLGKKLPKATGSASFALTNLGRVAQDAPFGFIAIQNNIGPLIDSFGYLAKEAKTTGQSLTSALTGALVGPAGLGLAISLVTAGLTLFAQSQQKAASEAKKAAVDGRSYIETLDGITAATLKGNQAAGEATTRLQILYKATQNNTLSLKDRNSAFDELNKQYPTFFTNADREKTLLGQNSEAYNRLASSIIAAAQARAFEQRIGENSNRRFEDLQKVTDKQTEIDKASLELLQARNRAEVASKGIAGNTQSSLTGGGGQANAALAAVGAVTQAQEKVNALTFERNKLITDANKLLQQNAKLAELALGAEQKAGFKEGNAFDDKAAKAKKAKTKFDPIGAGLGQSGIPLFENDFLTASVAQGGDLINKATEATRAFTDAKLNETNTRNNNAKAIALENELYDYTINAIGPGLTDVFASTLTGAQNLFTGLGQLLLGIVAKLVAAAAAAAALALILSFTPLGAAGGISGAFKGGIFGNGAGSFGSLFQGLAGLPKLAEGGIVSKPTLALIGEGKESEAVIPLSKLDAMMGASADRGSSRVEPFLLPNGILLQAVENGQTQRGRRGR